MTLTGPLAFYTLSANLVTELSDALVASPGGRPQRACVVPGQIAWDSCECGALYVSPTRFFLNDTFPASLNGEARTTPCELAWRIATITVQILRCAPAPQGMSVSVSCAQLDPVARVVVADAYLVQERALSYLCGLKETYEIADFTLGDQTTVGPQGTCVGSELPIYVSLPR